MLLYADFECGLLVWEVEADIVGSSLALTSSAASPEAHMMKLVEALVAAAELCHGGLEFAAEEEERGYDPAEGFPWELQGYNVDAVRPLYVLLSAFSTVKPVRL